MPTVDDLTVSLTIKDNSNLDKLRKNLDALIKSGFTGAGAGAGAGDIKKEITTIRKNISDINSQMNFLLPTISPPKGDVAGMQEYAKRVSGNIQKFKENIADFLTPEKLGSLQDLAEDLNITELTTANMQEGVERLLDKYDLITQSIAKGELVLKGSKAKKYLDLLSGIINDLLAGGSNLTRLRQVEKAIPEDLIQRTLEKVFEMVGIKHKGQFTMYKVGIKGADEETIAKWIEDVPAELVDKLKPMFKDKSVWEGLMYAMKDMGYSPEDLLSLFTDLETIKGKEDIENLVKAMLTLQQQGVIEKLAVPSSFRDLVKDATKVQLRAPGTDTMTKLDINILGGQVDELIKIIPTLTEATIDLIKELGVVPIELKGYLGAGEKGNLALQRDIYGAGMLKVVGSMITKNIRDDLESWGVESFTLPFLQDLMIQAGLTTPIQTQEQLAEAIGDVLEKADLDKLYKSSKDILEKIGTIKSDDDLKKILTNLLDAIKAGGIDF